MKIRLSSVFAAVGFVLAASLASAQGTTANPDDADHRELRRIKDVILTAFNERDYTTFLAYLHPNIVATWQNTEVARHPAGVQAFMKKMSEGDTKQIESAKAELTVDEPTTFYSDKNTGVVFGDITQDFKFVDGTNVRLKSRWTATFVREGGHWLLAAVHVSANIFDNPVLGIAVRKTALRVGIGSAVVGILLGALLSIGLRKRRAS